MKLVMTTSIHIVENSRKLNLISIRSEKKILITPLFDYIIIIIEIHNLECIFIKNKIF
jgi:hypothetical protein